MTYNQCRNCEFHVPIGKDTYVCNNEESEGYGLETAYDDVCENFKERAEEDGND